MTAESGWVAADAAERRTVASFSRYGDAQTAVNHLADRGFPVRAVRVVGDDIRYVEEVSGRRTWWRAVADAAGLGALAGFFFGLLFALFGLADPATAGTWLALWGLVLGGVAGAIVGAAWRQLRGGRRYLREFQRLEARRYDVLVDVDEAARAAQLLDDLVEQPARGRGPDRLRSGRR